MNFLKKKYFGVPLFLILGAAAVLYWYYYKDGWKQVDGQPNAYKSTNKDQPSAPKKSLPEGYKWEITGNTGNWFATPMKA